MKRTVGEGHNLNVTIAGCSSKVVVPASSDQEGNTHSGFNIHDMESSQSHKASRPSSVLTSASASSFPIETPVIVCPALIATVILDASERSLELME